MEKSVETQTREMWMACQASSRWIRNRQGRISLYHIPKPVIIESTERKPTAPYLKSLARSNARANHGFSKGRGIETCQVSFKAGNTQSVEKLRTENKRQRQIKEREVNFECTLKAIVKVKKSKGSLRLQIMRTNLENEPISQSSNWTCSLKYRKSYQKDLKRK